MAELLYIPGIIIMCFLFIYAAGRKPRKSKNKLSRSKPNVSNEPCDNGGCEACVCEYINKGNG